MNLEDKIVSLIDLQQEGDYWDFKLQWYEHEGNMLHDIICMANNLTANDGYIIIGISDDLQTFTDLSKDSYRRNTQQLTDFLKDIKFAGDIRPVVVVNTIKYKNQDLDVITIKNTNSTPYYLTTKYRGVFANQIYSRIQDTNTPKNSSADINIVEYLWKKRFGLTSTIMERLNIALDDWSNWGIYVNRITPDEFIQGGDWGNYNYIINKYIPEFKIEIDLNKYVSWECETMKCFYMNQTAGHWEAKIYYNNTILYNFSLAHVDEYRKFLVVPQNGSFINESHSQEIGPRARNDQYVRFYYITKDSIIGKIQKILTNNTYDTSCRYNMPSKYWLLIFENEEDYNNFKEFAENNQNLYKIGLKNAEYIKGDEEEGASIAMSDTHNAYFYYMNYLISRNRITQYEFDKYLNYFKLYIDN